MATKIDFLGLFFLSLNSRLEKTEKMAHWEIGSQNYFKRHCHSVFQHQLSQIGGKSVTDVKFQSSARASELARACRRRGRTLAPARRHCRARARVKPTGALQRHLPFRQYIQGPPSSQSLSEEFGCKQVWMEIYDFMSIKEYNF